MAKIWKCARTKLTMEFELLFSSSSSSETTENSDGTFVGTFKFEIKETEKKIHYHGICLYKAYYAPMCIIYAKMSTFMRELLYS